MEELIMSHTLELPDELYAALLKAADASGLTPIDWIAVHLLEARGKKEIEGEKMSHARTLADLFVGRVGLDVFGVAVRNGCPRSVERSSPTISKRNGGQGIYDSL
jgi:hypothetical protein